MFSIRSLKQVSILLESLSWINYCADRPCCCTQFFFLCFPLFKLLSSWQTRHFFLPVAFLLVRMWVLLVCVFFAHQDMCVCVCVHVCLTGMKKDAHVGQHGFLCGLMENTGSAHCILAHSSASSCFYGNIQKLLEKTFENAGNSLLFTSVKSTSGHWGKNIQWSIHTGFLYLFLMTVRLYTVLKATNESQSGSLFFLPLAVCFFLLFFFRQGLFGMRMLRQCVSCSVAV